MTESKPDITETIRNEGIDLKQRGRFPGRIKLGGNSVGWFNNEIDKWLSVKAAERSGIIEV
jgi:predicted DNA-binding transcriptional regulator AlpA